MQPRADPAGDDCVGLAAIQNPRRLGQGRQTRHVAQRDRIVRAAGVLRNAHVTGRHVGQILQHPQGEQLGRRRVAPAVEIKRALDHAAAIGADQLVQVARDQTRSEDHAQPLGIDRPIAQSRLNTRQIGRREGQLDVAAHHLQALPRPDVLFGVEVGHHSADGRRLAWFNGQVQPSDAASAFAERGPKRPPADADRAHHTNSSDDNTLLERHAVVSPGMRKAKCPILTSSNKAGKVRGIRLFDSSFAPSLLMLRQSLAITMALLAWLEECRHEPGPW